VIADTTRMMNTIAKPPTSRPAFAVNSAHARLR
jgi:hypothetical protein